MKPVCFNNKNKKLAQLKIIVYFCTLFLRKNVNNKKI